MVGIRRKVRSACLVIPACILRNNRSGPSIPSNIKFKAKETWILAVQILTDPEECHNLPLSMDLEMWSLCPLIMDPGIRLLLIMDPGNRHLLITDLLGNRHIPTTDRGNLCHPIMDPESITDLENNHLHTISMTGRLVLEKWDRQPHTTEAGMVRHILNRECRSTTPEIWFKIWFSTAIMEWAKAMEGKT